MLWLLVKCTWTISSGEWSVFRFCNLWFFHLANFWRLTLVMWGVQINLWRNERDLIVEDYIFIKWGFVMRIIIMHRLFNWTEMGIQWLIGSRFRSWILAALGDFLSSASAFEAELAYTTAVCVYLYIVLDSIDFLLESGEVRKSSLLRKRIATRERALSLSLSLAANRGLVVSGESAWDWSFWRRE